MNNLSNFIKNSNLEKHNFSFNDQSDEKLNQLSAAETNLFDSPNSVEKFASEYRLVYKIEDETYILQKSKLEQDKVIWIDVPLIFED